MRRETKPREWTVQFFATLCWAAGLAALWFMLGLGGVAQAEDEPAVEIPPEMNPLWDPEYKALLRDPEFKAFLRRHQRYQRPAGKPWPNIDDPRPWPVDCQDIVAKAAREGWPKEFGELVIIVIGPHKFRVPERYFVSPLGKKYLEGENHWKSVGFAFWFPGFCPTVVWNEYNPGFRTLEPGRSWTDNDDFIIRINSLSYLKNPELSVLPKKQYENFLKFRSGSFIASKELGLEKFFDKSTSLAMDKYYDTQTDKREVIFTCDRPGAKDVASSNPLCVSQMYLKKSQLYIYTWFPNDAISKWRDIEHATITFLRSVQVDGPQILGNDAP